MNGKNNEQFGIAVYNLKFSSKCYFSQKKKKRDSQEPKQKGFLTSWCFNKPMAKKKVILSVNINKYLGDHYMIILVDLVHRRLLIQNKVGLIFTCPNRKGRCTFPKRTYISLTLNSTLQETATQGMSSIFISFDLSQVLVTTTY